MKNKKKWLITLAVTALVSFIVLDFTGAMRKQDYDEIYASDKPVDFTQDTPGVERMLKIFTWEKDKNENLTYVEMKINKPVNTGPQLINDKNADGYKWGLDPESLYFDDAHITAQFDGKIEIKDDIESENPFEHSILSGKIKNEDDKDISKRRYYLVSGFQRVTMVTGANSVTVAWFIEHAPSSSLLPRPAVKKEFYMDDHEGYIDESGMNIYEIAYRYRSERYLYITAYDSLNEDVVRASATVKLTYLSVYYDWNILFDGDPLGLGNIHQSWTAELIEYYEVPEAYW